MKLGSCGLHCEVVKHSSFMTPTMVGGDVPFHLKFAFKMTNPLWKVPMLLIFAYNVSTIRASEKVQLWLIQSLPCTFQWAIGEVRMLPLTLQGVAQKSKFVVFVNNNQFISNKLCYKVCLCENLQWQVVVEPFLYLMIYSTVLAVCITLQPNI